MVTMCRKAPCLLLSVLLLAAIALPCFSDTRNEPVDLFLLVDKSLSMEEEIESVKSYVTNTLIQRFLIPGDRLILLGFYGKTELLTNRQLGSEAAKQELSGLVAGIRADGDFTDIGHALDTLKKTLDRERRSDRPVYLLLITDGIQEAPPSSPYFNPDGSFSHRFLENTKEIKREGWSIQILTIGHDPAASAAAQETARLLDADFKEIFLPEGQELKSGQIEEALQESYGSLSAPGAAVVQQPGEEDLFRISIRFLAEGFRTSQTVRFGTVSLRGERDDIPLEPDQQVLVLQPGEPGEMLFTGRLPADPAREAAEDLGPAVPVIALEEGSEIPYAGSPLLIERPRQEADSSGAARISPRLLLLLGAVLAAAAAVIALRRILFRRSLTAEDDPAKEKSDEV